MPLLVKISKNGELSNEEHNKKPDGSDFIHRWSNNNNNSEICMFSNKSGRYTNINKYQFVPEPFENTLFYGNVFFCLVIGGALKDLTLEIFNQFISDTNEGFEDIEETDDEYDEEVCCCEKDPCVCDSYSIGSFVVSDNSFDSDGDIFMG